MANEFTAEQGFDKVIFLRRLADAAQLDGTRLALQTTHTLSISSDSDSTATKDGSVNTLSSPETELEVENIASDDVLNDILWDSVKNHTTLEAWEVNLAKKDDDGQYFARYMRGYVNSMEEDNDADDNSTGDATFTIDGVPQDGWLKLSADQQAAIQYAFRGLGAVTDDDVNGGGVPVAVSLTLDKSSVSVEVGATAPVVSTLQPEGTADLVLFASSNESIATVDDKGTITGVAEGTTQVIARSGVLSASVKVTVTVASA